MAINITEVFASTNPGVEGIFMGSGFTSHQNPDGMILLKPGLHKEQLYNKLLDARPLMPRFGVELMGSTMDPRIENYDEILLGDLAELHEVMKVTARAVYFKGDGKTMTMLADALTLP